MSTAETSSQAPDVVSELRALSNDARSCAASHRLAAEVADRYATGVEMILSRHQSRTTRQRR